MSDAVAASPQIGKVLIEMGCLEPSDLERALRLQASRDERLGALLVKLGLLSDKDLAKALSRQLSLPLAQPDDYPKQALHLGEFSTKFLKRSRVVPIAQADGQVVLAMADPLDDHAVSAMQFAVGLPMARWVGADCDIAAALRRLYEDGSLAYEEIVDESEEEAPGGEADDDVARLRDMASEAPIIRLVNMIIARAVEERASDIHFEPFEDRLVVRYRIDGLLHEQSSPPLRMANAIVSRIKIMARLNIAERRLAQDGRVQVRINGKDIDMRVATMPSLHGETLVIRLLERQTTFGFEALGLGREIERALDRLLEQPYGMLIATGPTGSGKTTMLYSALQHLQAPAVKIITVEDPVEYQLVGVIQIQVKPQIGLSFANLLRSIVRQDPDVIMIGEMRDLETAQIAVQSALTGHLVLSTLHTNDAVGAVMRLLDMRVEDFLIASTLLGVMGQRLVRRLCPSCREPFRPNDALLLSLGAAAREGPDEVVLYKAIGCDECAGSGYVGRIGVFELLLLSERMRELILQRADSATLRAAAVEEGMVTMYADSLAKARAGVTTFEEVQRVVRDA